MVSFKKSFLLKSVALLVAALLAFQGEFLFAQAGDPLQESFAKAKAAYLAGEPAAAKEILEALLPELDKITGREALKGEASFLLGAAFEKLQAKEAAVKYFCLAKKLLGEGKAVEGIDLAGLEFYKEPCPPPPPPPPAVVQEDASMVQFGEAKAAFFAGNFELAKAILEKLNSELAKEPGRDTLKGEAFLLTGATYEKLKYKELSFKYFCLAKKILGKGRTIEGLELKPYKQYKKDCPVSGYAKVGKRGGGFGRLLTTLLGLGLLAVGGYFLYTKVIKKKEETKTIYYETDYQAWSVWSAFAATHSATDPTFSPENWGPNPSYPNYDGTSTLSITGPQIYTWNIKLAITACKGLTRRDTVWADDVQVLDVTNRFDRTCTGTIDDFANNPAAYDGKEYVIKSGSGEVTLKLRHKIVFTLPSGAKVQVVNHTVIVNK